MKVILSLLIIRYKNEKISTANGFQLLDGFQSTFLGRTSVALVVSPSVRSNAGVSFWEPLRAGWLYLGHLKYYTLTSAIRLMEVHFLTLAGLPTLLL